MEQGRGQRNDLKLPDQRTGQGQRPGRANVGAGHPRADRSPEPPANHDQARQCHQTLEHCHTAQELEEIGVAGPACCGLEHGDGDGEASRGTQPEHQAITGAGPGVLGVAVSNNVATVGRRQGRGLAGGSVHGQSLAGRGRPGQLAETLIKRDVKKIEVRNPRAKPLQAIVAPATGDDGSIEVKLIGRKCWGVSGESRSSVLQRLVQLLQCFDFGLNQNAQRRPNEEIFKGEVLEQWVPVHARPVAEMLGLRPPPVELCDPCLQELGMGLA